MKTNQKDSKPATGQEGKGNQSMKEDNSSQSRSQKSSDRDSDSKSKSKNDKNTTKKG